ncbi:hypothetical protein DPMN_119045 [Dreissena polymorpha]|uniref:Uncharacterized protein n=1 Tax=Dreissena polymorpha TaxID=45954 RepID=A0A9D4JRM3_DREPO|nr:hypothetical protein DPMN_119045 [Dreissena polymorpha]
MTRECGPRLRQQSRVRKVSSVCSPSEELILGVVAAVGWPNHNRQRTRMRLLTCTLRRRQAPSVSASEKFIMAFD